VVYDLGSALADYPVWEGKPSGSLLVCTHLRSGSTLLGEAMYAAGDMGCPIEYFHSGFQPAFMERWGTLDFPSYLDAVYRRRTAPNGTLGVKLFWTDVEDLSISALPGEEARLRGEFAAKPAPATYLNIFSLLSDLFPNPRFIYLVRRDRLRQAVSLVKAGQTKSFRRIPGIRDSPREKVPEYDYDQIAGCLALGDYCHRHWRELFRVVGIEPYRLYYEDLAGNFPGTLRELYRSLGMPGALIAPPRLERQADRASEEFLLRYLEEDRRRQLSGNP
jgi:LPS sulfotransferase NodH